MLTDWPGRKYSFDAGTRVASFETVSLSLRLALPSKARIAVNTLVVLAGGKRKSASF
jgi:hypothetical protein